MSIVNRRNAVLGWATWKVHKHRAKKKARQAMPGVDEGRPNKAAIAAAGAAALAGSVLFWRKARKRGDTAAEGEGEGEGEGGGGGGGDAE
jgi:hypothetical protein